MKRFFAKATKPFAINIGGSNNSNKDNSTPDAAPGPGPSESGQHGRYGTPGSTSTTAPHTTPGLKPKYRLPAVPHPYPYDHLAILVAPEGLLVRPYVPGQSKRQNPASTHLKIAWQSGEIVEVQDDVEGVQLGKTEKREEEARWKESVIVYGIVGMLELFSCPYLLVINSRTEVGNILDPSNTVYGLKGVTAIPLIEDRARTAVTVLASRNAALSRPSLIARAFTTDDVLGPNALSPLSIAGVEENSTTSPNSPPRSSSPRVQFASDTDVKIMTPALTPVPTREPENPTLLNVEGLTIERPSSAQSCRSDISVPSSENSMVTSPVFKTLAQRLSFWSRISKRPANGKAAGEGEEGEEGVEFPMTMNPSSLSEEREMLDRLMEKEQEPAKVVETIVQATAPPPSTAEEKHKELEEKVVRECIKELTKGCMYWAYNFDITRSLQHKQEQIAKSHKQHELLQGLGALPTQDSPPKEGDKVSPLAEPYPTLPLWRRVDRNFWWNEWMAKPFVDAGLHPYVLPIMQGYIQPAVLTIPNPDESEADDVIVDYILVSRRSRHRVGLRYQRRGVDDEAHVANFVETETIVRVEREKTQNIFSYVQIRGSIPLYWTQSGYSLKPPPVLASDRTHQQNLDALSRHFKRTIPIYGPHTVVNLAEQGGREGALSQAYREYVVEFDNKDIQYCDYDFHHETKGMKYENINKLVEQMQRVFESQGYLWICDDTVLSHQKGVFRVNCIDCLDRTNVVQSAFARYVLNRQLSAVALLTPSVIGGIETDLIFNDVWANNGDAISRAYAGTSALKGDFTRTGKRDLSGMLNDGVNSLARMYTSTFSDWFSQAVIDFMLGSRTKSVFSEFLLKLQSTDPRDLIRLSKIRAEAIATSTSRVLPEGEHLVSGWTLFAPEELNAKVALKFEEKVLLLSPKALYIVSYDYTLEKVKLYTRVPLGDVVSITKGAYILSPLEEASRDPEQNAGFVITWLTSSQESRSTSYSVRNDIDLGALSNPSSPTSPRYPISVVSPKRGQSVSELPINLLLSRTAANMGLRRNNTLPALALHGPGSSSGSNSVGGEPKPKSPTTVSSTAFVDPAAEKSFAAFKVLPIDPARVRRASSSYSEMSDEMQTASTCKEAADMIVETIYRACMDVGAGHSKFLIEEDVVSLAEAQKMTTVYAKMEYGLKRLLWLGG